MKTSDPVFDICRQVLENSPERSFKRLNPALHSTLTNCIKADLPFQPDTFRRICDELRGSWWFGDGGGSHLGEHFYTLACELNHASAQQSFEEFAGRPPVLWEEQVKTTFRLHVGAQFTWQGHHVTVTSMRKDSLIACTYKDYPARVKGLRPGATIGDWDHEFLVVSAKQSGKAVDLRAVPAPKGHGEREVARRFTIPYAEISELRRTCKARVKAMIQRIAESDPNDRPALIKDINGQHFRHFELEQLNQAFKARKDWLANAESVAAWRTGRNGAWLDTKDILLRVNGDRIEASNGNAVSRAAAVKVLPILLHHPRSKSVTVDIPLDGHRVTQLSPKGVTIGCTLVPWPEVELVAQALQAAA